MSQVVKVIVDIGDINDNSPRFRNSTAAVGVRESAAPGTSFALPVATDPDSPALGVRAYELLDADGRPPPAGPDADVVALSIVTRRDGSDIIYILTYNDRTVTHSYIIY